MNEKLRRDSLITIISLAVVVALFTFVIYLPGLKSKQQLNKQIASIQEQIRAIPTKVEQLEQLQEELQQREAFINRMKKHIPTDKDTHRVLQRVAQLANSSSLTVSSLNPGEPVPYATYLRQPFTVNVSGPYKGLIQFLNGLDTDSRLFTVSNLMLTSQYGENTGLVKGTVELSVYVLRDTESDFSDFKENRVSRSFLSTDKR
ncbi:type IV pilus inner membrane component PilO [Gimesia chilikensis]|uniref:type 4a pilus biogenesis protein PilO n=1 Tax=Gimesia chilikensis TaxID=2605989 RepID=UPI001659E123|nr:type 4a pilus biogenesis protein PilO [Gimesia chilikensis]